MKWLINPFERIAGWQALFIGLAAMALTAVTGKINGVAFDGILDVHTGASFGYLAAFAMQTVNFLAMFLTMWLAGICFSKSKPRAIDIAGTMALARAPMLLLAVICFLPVTPACLYDTPRIIIFGLISIFFIIWMIALMYNAYSVSCNLKGGRAVISFIGALLAAEVVSKLVFIFLLTGLFTGVQEIHASEVNSTGNTVIVVDSLTIRQKAEKVVAAFERNDFDAITVYYDATMKREVPASRLKTVWAQAVIAYGKFEKAGFDDLKESRIDKYDVIEVPLFFQREKLNLQLAFNEDGTIAGLFILPGN